MFNRRHQHVGGEGAEVSQEDMDTFQELIRDVKIRTIYEHRSGNALSASKGMGATLNIFAVKNVVFGLINGTNNAHNYE